jgi:hypothetical protein
MDPTTTVEHHLEIAQEYVDNEWEGEYPLKPSDWMRIHLCILVPLSGQQ